MRHSTVLEGDIRPEIAQRYFDVEGFACKSVTRADGSVLVAAKKGGMNKWGYIFAHTALIVICLGGLIDSNLLLKLGIWSGRIVLIIKRCMPKILNPRAFWAAGTCLSAVMSIFRKGKVPT